ncbi:unnamed protein product [Gordionus sp. m RMFG-2023]
MNIWLIPIFICSIPLSGAYKSIARLTNGNLTSSTTPAQLIVNKNSLVHSHEGDDHVIKIFLVTTNAEFIFFGEALPRYKVQITPASLHLENPTISINCYQDKTLFRRQSNITRSTTRFKILPTKNIDSYDDPEKIYQLEIRGCHLNINPRFSNTSRNSLIAIFAFEVTQGSVQNTRIIIPNKFTVRNSAISFFEKDFSDTNDVNSDPDFSSMRDPLKKLNSIRFIDDEFLLDTHHRIPILKRLITVIGDRLRSVDLSGSRLLSVDGHVGYEGWVKDFLIDDKYNVSINNNYYENIEELRLEGCQVTEAIWSVIPNFFGLRALFLGFNNLTSLFQEGLIVTVNHTHPVNNELSKCLPPKLESLDLSNNCKNQSPTSFYKKSSIKCDTSPSLKHLMLGGNRLTSFPAQLILTLNATNITKLDLSHNQISFLKTNSIPSTYVNSIQILNVSYNFMETLSVEAFSGMRELARLDLSHNALDLIDAPQYFRDIPYLTHLNLSFNIFSDLKGLFTYTGNLKDLDIGNNDIKNLNLCDISSSVELLNATQNSISIVTYSICAEDHGSSITVLDLSYNGIDRLTVNSFPRSLSKLILVGNRITQLGDNHQLFFANLPNLKMLNLEFNLISNLSSKLFLNPFLSHEAPNVRVALKGNQLLCDCHFDWIADIYFLVNTSNIPSGVLILDDLRELRCFDPYRKFQILVVDAIYLKLPFVCPYTDHCFPMCRCCQFFYCDCKLICPKGCSCYSDATWNFNAVVCDSLALTHVPEQVPKFATVIKMGGNNLTIIRKATFFALFELKELYLNSSKIMELENKAFARLTRLEFLDLSNNLLTHLAPDMFEGTFSIKFLNLSRNRLTVLDYKQFAAIYSSNLKTLDLSYNLLHSLDSKFLSGYSLSPSLVAGILSNDEMNHNQKSLDNRSIYLSHNPLSCQDCQLFQIIANTTRSIVADLDDLSCKLTLPVEMESELLIKFFTNGAPVTSYATDGNYSTAHLNDSYLDLNVREIWPVCPNYEFGDTVLKAIVRVKLSRSDIVHHRVQLSPYSTESATPSSVQYSTEEYETLLTFNGTSGWLKSIYQSEKINATNYDSKHVIEGVINKTGKGIPVENNFKTWTSTTIFRVLLIGLVAILALTGIFGFVSFIRNNSELSLKDKIVQRISRPPPPCFDPLLRGSDDQSAQSGLKMESDVSTKYYWSEYQKMVAPSNNHTKSMIGNKSDHIPNCYSSKVSTLLNRFRREPRISIYDYDVFVSYAHKETSFVRSVLVPGLERARKYKLCLEFSRETFLTEVVNACAQDSRKIAFILTHDTYEGIRRMSANQHETPINTNIIVKTESREVVHLYHELCLGSTRRDNNAVITIIVPDHTFQYMAGKASNLTNRRNNTSHQVYSYSDVALSFMTQPVVMYDDHLFWEKLCVFIGPPSSCARIIKKPITEL